MSNAYLPASQRYSQPTYNTYNSYDQLHPLTHESADDRDEPFDVRADFDGDGPKWSDLYGAKPQALLRDPESGVDYRKLDSHVAPSGQMQAYGAPTGTSKIETNGEELVSVPVLGPE
jgi:hypothetical protein